ncbi:LysE family translocator [uncultured Roseobacter sp.]|uniref:LysE family translocator n=1 Tax=uncultured Roseobacter sp. TaxID=114847 RepID=UPI002605B03D|nr:LysE family translocator [uncultured Roseobacter sp.]
MAEYLPQLMLAWSIQFMGVISPGPGIMLILGSATNQGRLTSIVTAFGIACASIVLSTATVLGLAALMAEMADLMTYVWLIGAGYLTWLAYKAFRIAALNPASLIKVCSASSAWRSGLTGFALQLSNPKAIFFWLAVASVGGVGNAPISVVLIFITGAFVISFAGHGGYALILSSEPIRRGYFRARRWVESGLACFFLFAGFTLATTESR